MDDINMELDTAKEAKKKKKTNKQSKSLTKDLNSIAKIIKALFKIIFYISITFGIAIGALYFAFYAHFYPEFDAINIITYVVVLFCVAFCFILIAILLILIPFIAVDNIISTSIIFKEFNDKDKLKLLFFIYIIPTIIFMIAFYFASRFENFMLYIFLLAGILILMAISSWYVISFKSIYHKNRIDFILNLLAFIFTGTLPFIIFPFLSASFLFNGTSALDKTFAILAIVYLTIFFTYFMYLFIKQNHIKTITILSIVLVGVTIAQAVANQNNIFIVGPFKLLKIGGYEANLTFNADYLKENIALKELNGTKSLILSSIGKDYIVKRNESSTLIYKIPKDKVASFIIYDFALKKNNESNTTTLKNDSNASKPIDNNKTDSK